MYRLMVDTTECSNEIQSSIYFKIYWFEDLIFLIILVHPNVLSIEINNVMTFMNQNFI